MTAPTTRRTPRPLTAWWAAAGLAAFVLAAGCSSGDDAGGSPAADAPVEESDPPEPPADDEPDTDVAEPRPPEDDPDEPAEIDDRAVIAEAQVPTVAVLDAPEDGQVIHELAHPREVGAPLTFLVDEQDGDWLQVLLPVRPNGSTGWIHVDDVALAATSYRVEVELSAYRLTVYRGDEVHLESEIGVGGDGTPTPPGRYYVTELLQPPSPDGPYGPYAFGLSGFSEVHLDFAGGDGVIGIHGTDDPSSIGGDSSNGCIRVDNDVISEMATFLPLGVPVEVIA